MPPQSRAGPHIELAVRNLLVDRLTAEVAGIFSGAGIECMLIKGPVIGGWLYHDGTRGYIDSDLLVADSDWDRATAALANRGFHDYLGPVHHPRIKSAASTAFVRGSEALDLHRSLDGLEAPPERVWDSLWKTAERQVVGGREVAIPAHPAVLMHLTLHAAHHHAAPKPLEDLRRGIRVGSPEEWKQAAGLAEQLDGLAAFASGLRRLPEGVRLAQELGVEAIGSVQHDLRLSGVPTAEGLHELLGPGLTVPERTSLLLAELFPTQAFMRSWVALARRGKRGLLVSYPFRWVWLAVKVPAGLFELRRTWRRRAGL